VSAPHTVGKPAQMAFEAKLDDVPAIADLTKSVDGIDLVGILSGVEETAYRWDLRTDKVEWESNAAFVLGMRSTCEIATGSGFQFLIAPQHLARRQHAIGVNGPAANAARGVPYRVQYRFMPGGRRSTTAIWLEDHGRWWAGADGRPAHAQGVIRVINERHQEEQRLLQRSDYDELTGQLNRIRLTEALSAVIARSTRSGHSSAFLIASVNKLGMINETFGFDVGDQVITEVGKVIGERLRGSDTVGRYSSNKFGIILNDCGPGSVRIAAERFIKGMRETKIKTTACPLAATISIGGVMLPEQAPTVTLAISRSLHALEKARAKRHDTFVGFEPSSLQENLRQRNIQIADEVISALDENRMRLVLQPVVACRTGKPAFYECLLRIKQADGSLNASAGFIEIAEQLGLSRLIDRRTLELAMALLRQHGDLVLSLNVSALTCNDHEWLVALHKLSGGQKSILSRLIVEITETTAIGDMDQTVAFADALRELGCRVAIDDFGAGYTSFRNLKHIEANLVKIDGGFVKNLAADPTDRIFIKMLAELASALGMDTVAEWVSDEATVKMLGDLGITYMQGFHCGTPTDPDQLPQTDKAASAH
jgi:diguanylate cyclase (GGDEF)-like protein